MIIEQKLNHGGPRDLFIRPVAGGEADQPDRELGSRAGRRALVARQPVPLLHRRDRRRDAPVPRRGAAAARVEQVTKGPRRLGGLTIDKAFTTIAYTVGVHDAPAERLRRRTSTASDERRLTNVHGRIASEIAFSKAERLRWTSNDGTADRRLADVPVRLRRRARARIR